MHNKTIAELSQSLHQKEISSAELTQYFLDRIHQFNPSINSFITICDQTAIKAAKKADEMIAEGKATVLTGIPIAHKDNLCTKNVETTCGSKILGGFVSPYDATTVAKLKYAGMVILGKTNLDEFAMGSSNENSFYGPVKNPWNLKTVPGGSSGGSTAAVAARMTPASTGTDTGGSIRQPAALCGVTGLKPTYGRVSRYGLIAFASSLDQAGPVAQTAEDTAILLNAMAGFDLRDSTSMNEVVPDYTKHLNDSVKGLRIGLPKEYFSKNLDPKIADVVHTAAKTLEKQGAILHEISLPTSHLAIPVYYVIAPAEASSNLSRYDGVRYGYRCENPKDLLDMYTRTRTEGFGEEVKHRIMIGTYVLSSGQYNVYYKKAQKVRRLISQDFLDAFKKVDVILGPTSPSTAFRLGSRTKNRVAMYLSDIFTVNVNLAGLPGISVPCGFVKKLPIGLQLIGNYFEEARILNVAHQYQQLTNWHQQIPEGFE